MFSRKFIFLIVAFIFPLFAQIEAERIQYPLTDEPIDVVIVTHPKDKKTLDLCIEAIKEYCDKVHRVIVVSSENLTDQAEWFDESQFPFSKHDIAMAIVRGNKRRLAPFFENNHRSPGWYYQQMLKLYSPLIIPDISSNVLIIDSDTILLNPVKFLNESNGAMFCANHEKPKPAYFEHAKRLVPGYKRIYPKIYSVCHHMLLQKPILEDLFRTVEEYHGTEFWVAFCSCVDLKHNRGASEFEIYYNFALRHTKQVEVRDLKWVNSGELSKMENYRKRGYHFASFHTYLRRKGFPITFPEAN